MEYDGETWFPDQLQKIGCVILKGLDRSRVEPTVCCLHREGEYIKKVEDLGIEVCGVRITTYRHWRFSTELIKLIRLIRERKPDIVHTYLFPSSTIGMVAAKAAGTPIVVTTRRGDNRVAKSSHILAYRYTNFLVDCIIAVSEASRQSSISTEKVDPEKIITIRNGIDPRFFNGSPGGEEIKRSLGLSPRNVLIGSIGKFAPVKGHIDLIRAIPYIVSRHEEARFLLIGDGPLKPSFDAEIDRLGISKYVLFPGVIEDITTILPGLDLVAAPSLSEGISNTILEGMLAAKPVVATRVDGNLEVVEEGVTGFLVPPKDPQAFAERLLYCLDHPRQMAECGSRGRERVLSEFSYERMMSGVYEIYTRLMGARIPRSEKQS